MFGFLASCFTYFVFLLCIIVFYACGLVSVFIDDKS